jgi:antagonist of KipI
MLEVIDGGLLTTVQDAGRPESVGLGVPVGGACDSWSLRVANVLAGNQPDEPVIEMTLAGPTFRVLRDCVIGLAGADLGGRVSETGRLLAAGRSHMLSADQTVAFGVAAGGRGIRSYLALAGGLDVPAILGSASTCLVAGFGGLDGRSLAAGDVLRPARSEESDVAGLAGRSWAGGPQPALQATLRPLRVVEGPHLDRLAPNAFDRFVRAEYRASPRGNRQAVWLDGPRVRLRGDAGEMLSLGVAWGSIQVHPDGHPVCMLADRQTVGGYPVLAVVISADLPALGQLGPTDAVRFSAVSLEQARAALLEQEAAWRAQAERLRPGVP